jgi:hypothetical protein
VFSVWYLVFCPGLIKLPDSIVAAKHQRLNTKPNGDKNPFSHLLKLLVLKYNPKK